METSNSNKTGTTIPVLSQAQLARALKTAEVSASSISAAVDQLNELNQNLYDQLFSVMLQEYPEVFGTENDQLQYQFPNPALIQSATWADQVNEVNSLIQQFELGDRAPVEKEGRYTADASSQSIFTRYSDWIQAVPPGDPNADPAYGPANQARLQAAAALQNIVVNAQGAWEAWNAANPEEPLSNIEAWLSQSEPPFQAEPFATQYQVQNRSLQRARAAVTRIIENIDPGLAEAQDAVSNPEFLTSYSYSPPIGNATMFMAGTTAIGDASDNPITDFQDWTNGNTTRQRPLTAVVAEGTVPVSRTQLVGRVTETRRFSFFFGLFSLSTSRQVSFYRQVVTSEGYRMSIDFRSARPYPVVRSGWFDLNVLQLFSDRQFNSPIDFFNPETGPLYLVPRTVFLGWNPQLRLTLSNLLYEEWKEALLNEEGVYIGNTPIGRGQMPQVVPSSSPGFVDIIFGDQDAPESINEVPTIIGYVHNRVESTIRPPGA